MPQEVAARLGLFEGGAPAVTKRKEKLIESYSLSISSLKEKLKMNEEEEKKIIN